MNSYVELMNSYLDTGNSHVETGAPARLCGATAPRFASRAYFNFCTVSYCRR